VVESLPGCVSQSKTVEEALANIKEAILQKFLAYLAVTVREIQSRRPSRTSKRPLNSILNL
jgi:predicted RNase H-like HicB family nuclease